MSWSLGVASRFESNTLSNSANVGCIYMGNEDIFEGADCMIGMSQSVACHRPPSDCLDGA